MCSLLLLMKDGKYQGFIPVTTTKSSIALQDADQAKVEWWQVGETRGHIPLWICTDGVFMVFFFFLP